MWGKGHHECCARLSGHGSRVGHNCSHLRSSSLHALSGQLYDACTNEHMCVCCVRPCTSRVPDLRWRDERGHAVANCSKPYERASEEAATRTPARPPELAKPSMPLLVRHRCAATGARVLCRPRRDAWRACDTRDRAADVSMVCSRSGSQRAMISVLRCVCMSGGERKGYARMCRVYMR